MIVPHDGYWLPTATSTIAYVVDDPFWLIYWVCTVTFVLITVPTLGFAWGYRERAPGQKALSQNDHSRLLELSWSVLPLVFFFWTFVVGFRGFLEMFVTPAGATEVQVTAQKWSWSITYEHQGQPVVVGGVGADFKFPKGKKFKLVMHSVDVVHSFFVPNFRIKSDVIPGRYTTLWFEATKAGVYPLLCAEYCGQDHSNMLARIVITETEDEWRAWLAEEADPSKKEGYVPAEHGKQLYESRCASCHSTTGEQGPGTRFAGPSLKGLWGKTEQTDKGAVVIDDEHLRESIWQPQEKIVVGYGRTMPVFQGQLTPVQVDALIAFIKSLDAPPGAP
ncbi:MAG: cytochrome c oxidase subunit II [Deltaproteobacteria bacterium]|nr:cytochrome c oxidase subunit II [Deltaproteobacteria bacterium]